MGYDLGGRCSLPSRGKSFLFSMAFTPALGLTQPLIRLVAGPLAPWVKLPGREIGLVLRAIHPLCGRRLTWEPGQHSDANSSAFLAGSVHIQTLNFLVRGPGCTPVMREGNAAHEQGERRVSGSFG